MIGFEFGIIGLIWLVYIVSVVKTAVLIGSVLFVIECGLGIGVIVLTSELLIST